MPEYLTNKEETKLVKSALKTAGYNARVGHGKGTAYGWIKVSIKGPETWEEFHKSGEYGKVHDIIQHAAKRDHLVDDIQTDLFMVCINVSYEQIS